MHPFTLKKLIEYSYLTVAWFSAIACLVRTDYNFTVALFGYYYWVTRQNDEKLKPLMYLTGFMVVIDLIWLVTTGNNWVEHNKLYRDWEANRSIRTAAIVFSSLNLIIKVAQGGLLYLAMKGTNNKGEAEPMLGASKQQQGGRPTGNSRFAQF
mmetsp:Transcript_18342/g.21133  ORF Transcript_18342/g.21133 Transcript_18342/m.21133 type:complete len:153 (-) Transcript_18342:48-506(-)